MADYTVSAAAVLPGAGASIKHGTSAATITAGKAVVIDPTTGNYVLADTNHATAALRVPSGIALNGASAGQPVAVQTSGPITLGAVLTAGVAVMASDTPGGLCPAADVGAGERSVLIGLPTSTSVLDIDIQDSGVAL